jgi:(2Fe-2S) ferredoxin
MKNNKYSKHIFVCTNTKAPGKKCCGEEHGMQLVEAFRNELKQRGITKEMRVQRAGCLDVCAQGPACVVYPEGIFYGNLQIEDVPELVEKHLIGEESVVRLQLTFD